MIGKSGGVRISTAEREEAVRRLRLYFQAGYLDADEVEERIQIAQSAKTATELKRVFVSLPELSRSPSVANRVAENERAIAKGRLRKGLDRSQIDFKEYSSALDRVENARTSQEISAALAEAGLPVTVQDKAISATQTATEAVAPKLQSAAQTTANVGKAMLRLVMAVLFALTGIVFGLFGVWLVVAVCAVLVVALLWPIVARR